MEKNSVGSAVVKSIVLVILGAIIILGVYMILTRNKKPAKDEDYVLTTVDEITTTDLSRKYPADARKVVDLYGKIMRTLYKETYTDDQQNKMIEVLAGIMDDELLENQNNFAKSIKNEVKSRKEGDYSIATYVVQAQEPEVVKVDGRKMCTIECLFSLRQGTGHIVTTYDFIMRQDSLGRWKILGWTVKADE